MHSISITMVNNDGDRYTVIRHARERSTPAAHEICRKVEAEVNNDESHACYGPWKIATHNWQS